MGKNQSETFRVSLCCSYSQLIYIIRIGSQKYRTRSALNPHEGTTMRVTTACVIPHWLERTVYSGRCNTSLTCTDSLSRESAGMSRTLWRCWAVMQRTTNWQIMPFLRTPVFQLAGSDYRQMGDCVLSFCDWLNLSQKCVCVCVCV